jgi:diacylglycerol kinase (ATP)
MANEKWSFIVNPVAGNGFAATYLPKLKSIIDDRQLDAEIVFTEYPGHATKLALERAEQGYRYIIGVGGDGTMNEICRSLIGCPGIITGLIPAGTGNDFVQILGFHDHLNDQEWDIFFRKETRALDTGNCNGKVFLNGMGLGFDAQVAAENYDEKGMVKKGGKNKYIWHILKTLIFFREKHVRIQSGRGTVETNCFIHTISIGRRFAGGFFLTPEAIADDGLLDVCMIRKLSLLQRLRILLKVPHGTHIRSKRVEYYRTSKIQLEFDEKVPFHVDGELFFDTVVNVEVHPRSLNIIYNPEGNHYFERASVSAVSSLTA